ncbi:MAG: CocE/NonD family hydrolase [Actinobacteria bacterium]|nr:MAG: CocE/NonD family hydrolase [Actinomycetota bacterium]
MLGQGVARSTAIAAIAAGVSILVAAAQADVQSTQTTKIPPGAKWSQAYIKEKDGTMLHADIERPAQLPASARTPVILSIGPYFNHSGQVGPAAPVEGVPFDPTAAKGPSTRFYDFVTGAHLMQRGYTYVMVDLRGFGGSTGCLDWAGPGEQADVKAAVEWAARQPWSTGRVGMYGKSYDAVTGLIGVALHPRGLRAVVAQEPVYDLYRYLYMNRVRFANSLATPALYDGIAATPGTTGDTLAYNFSSINDTQKPGCPAQNYSAQQDPNHSSPYWRERDLIRKARGARTPLFMTQGFIEDNTKPDGAFNFFNELVGPRRAWFGMWDHVRGNERTTTGRLKMGRRGWFDEVMRWYDRYVAGKPLRKAAVNHDPPIAVESSNGKWRSEKAWPPADSRGLSIPLRSGSYVDDGQNEGTSEGGPPNGEGIWTFSRPLPRGAHFAGVPHVALDASAGAPDGNLVVDVYDIGPKGGAVLISRGAYLLDAGTNHVRYDLYGDDWILHKRHRIGVLVTSSNAEWWAHVPTGQSISIGKARITLEFLRCGRRRTIQGQKSVKLQSYLGDARFPVDPATIAAATSRKFPIPKRERRCGNR